VSFATSLRVEFHDLAKQFWKGIPTFYIVKNIVCSNKGNVRLLTIVLSIIVPMLLASLQKN